MKTWSAAAGALLFLAPAALALTPLDETLAEDGVSMIECECGRRIAEIHSEQKK